MSVSFSIVVPAYNEEENIRDAASSVLKACKRISTNFEIILVDDGSTDQTGKIMDNLARTNRHIHVLRNAKNRGFGYSFRRGIKKSTKEYIGGFPGDNDMSWKSLLMLMKDAGEADVISSYMSNPSARSSLRRIVSRSYVVLMNLLFLLNLHYYNGHFIAARKSIQSLDLCSDGIAVLGEIKILLLKKGASLKEIPFEHTGRLHGASKILTVRGISQALGNTVSLFKRVYFS